MRGVACPVLLVVGALDTITPPACLERAAGIFPHARLRIVPGCGHMTPLEAPEIFNVEVEDFLRGVAVDRAVADRIVAGQPARPAGLAGHSDPGANPAVGEH